MTIDLSVMEELKEAVFRSSMSGITWVTMD